MRKIIIIIFTVSLAILLTGCMRFVPNYGGIDFRGFIGDTMYFEGGFEIKRDRDWRGLNYINENGEVEFIMEIESADTRSYIVGDKILIIKNEMEYINFRKLDKSGNVILEKNYTSEEKSFNRFISPRIENFIVVSENKIYIFLLEVHRNSSNSYDRDFIAIFDIETLELERKIIMNPENNFYDKVMRFVTDYYKEENGEISFVVMESLAGDSVVYSVMTIDNKYNVTIKKTGFSLSKNDWYKYDFLGFINNNLYFRRDFENIIIQHDENMNIIKKHDLGDYMVKSITEKHGIIIGKTNKKSVEVRELDENFNIVKDHKIKKGCGSLAKVNETRYVCIVAYQARDPLNFGGFRPEGKIYVINI